MEPTDRSRAKAARSADTAVYRSLAGFVAYLDEPCLLFDSRQQVVYANAAASRFTGYSAEDLLGLHREVILQEPEREHAGADAVSGERVVVVVHRDGLLREVASRVVSLGDYSGILLMPLAGEAASGGALSRYIRALRTLTECARITVRAETETELLRESCRLLVQVGGYRYCWIGYREADGTVIPVAQRGFREGFLASHQLSWLESAPTGRGVVGTCIRTGKPAVIHNVLDEKRFRPWWQLAREYGIRAGLGLPLTLEGETVGAVAFYAAESDAFGDDETELLQEVVADMAFGIAARRLQKLNRRTRRALQRTVAELQYQKRALDLHAIVCVVGPDGLIDEANRKACRALGVEAEALIGRPYDDFIAFECHPPGFADVLRQQLESGRAWQGGLAIRSPERGIRRMETTVVPFLDPDARIERFVMVATDVTATRP